MSETNTFSEQVLYSIEVLLARTQDSLEGCLAVVDTTRRSEDMEEDVRPALHVVADSLDSSRARLGSIRDLIDFGEKAPCFKERR